jgi:hypothetical protein
VAKGLESALTVLLHEALDLLLASALLLLRLLAEMSVERALKAGVRVLIGGSGGG